MTTAEQPPSDTPTAVDRLMKRCQVGVGGRNALNDAHDIMAECYGTLGRLQGELAAAQAAVKGADSTIRALRADCDAAQATIARQAEELERVRKDAGLAKQIARGIIGDKALDQGRLSMLRAVLVRIEALAAAEKEPAK